jgi:hypothetical protein
MSAKVRRIACLACAPGVRVAGAGDQRFAARAFGGFFAEARRSGGFWG